MTANQPTPAKSALPKRLRFRARSVAFKNFSENLSQTKLLLNVGLSGITTNVEQIETIIAKFGDTKFSGGRTPKNYEPSVEATRTDTGDVNLSLDERSAALLKRAMKLSRAKHKALRFHLYSILAVAIWGLMKPISLPFSRNYIERSLKS